MAYNEFAYFYDELNGEADYDALYTHVHAQLKAHGIEKGIVADLGCGTGDLTLMLAQAGYDMIGVDQSGEMLAVLREKADELGVAGRLLLLRQDILALDLYGTTRAAVSTFDTLNHIGPKERFEQAIYRAAFFMEKGGVFVFDLNTPYKHRQVLGNNTFQVEGPDAVCRWENRCSETGGRVDISLQIRCLDTGETFREEFAEYTYEPDYVRAVLGRCGFSLESVCDGETFGPLAPESQRMCFTAIKQYTQMEKQQDV